MDLLAALTFRCAAGGAAPFLVFLDQWQVQKMGAQLEYQWPKYLTWEELEAEC